jgi:type IV secretion system protein VirB1
MDGSTFLALLLACAPQVDPTTARALVAVESAFEPNAIGVVAGALERQPRNAAEALATAAHLQAAGWNYSLGLAQINARNFGRLGLTARAALEPCANLAAMQVVLLECFDRAPRKSSNAQQGVRQALSCYYSGNFTTGFSHGYVRRVARAVRASAAPPAIVPRPKETS